MSQTTEKKEKAAKKYSRFREILTVLRKHKVLKSMTPEKLCLVFIDLGPTFIKFGQILSMRQDILPEAYCTALCALRSDINPLPFAVIQKVILEELMIDKTWLEEDLTSSFHPSLKSIFKSIEENPIGSASIAQVHRAELLSGERVVLKVQRPDIFKVMDRDVKLLKRLIRFYQKFNKNISKIIDIEKVLMETWATAQLEMNFLNEAANLREYQINNKDIKYVTCPSLYSHYTTAKLLTMSDIEGIPIHNVERLKESGYDLKDIGEKLVENYCKQILDDGFFQADPHPGNLHIFEGKIVWLDLGMMARLNGSEKIILRNIVTGIAEQNSDKIVTVMLGFTSKTGTVDKFKLYEDVDFLLNKYSHLSMQEINIVDVLNAFLKISSQHQLVLPEGLTMLIRGCLTMQGTLLEIDPNAVLIDMMKNYIVSSEQSKEEIKKKLFSVSKRLVRSLDHFVDLPTDIAQTLKHLSQGRTSLNFIRSDSKMKHAQQKQIANQYTFLFIFLGFLFAGVLLYIFSLKDGAQRTGVVPGIVKIFWGFAVLSLAVDFYYIFKDQDK